MMTSHRPLTKLATRSGVRPSALPGFSSGGATGAVADVEFAERSTVETRSRRQNDGVLVDQGCWAPQRLPEPTSSGLPDRNSEKLKRPQKPGSTWNAASHNPSVVGSSPTRAIDESPPLIRHEIGRLLGFRCALQTDQSHPPRFAPGLSTTHGGIATEDPDVSPDRTHTGWLS